MEFNGGEEDFASERMGKGFPTRSLSDSIYRGGLKHEVLKVTPEEAETEMGEKQVFFKAVAIVGDFNGNVGLGVDVALKPNRAARGAINFANENIVSIRRGHWGVHKHGLPHTIFCKVSSVVEELQVRVNPAPRGTGITGPPLARKLLEFAGVQDAYVIIRGEEPELAILCKAILSAVKDTFTIFQDHIHQIHNVRRKEDLVTYSSSKVAELLPFNQPKGSCGNIGLFIPEMVDEPPASETADPKEGVAVMPQTFSDFVPGAKAHATATYSDEDKENFNSKAAVLMDDAAADAQDADKYIEEINKMSSQLKDFEVKEGVPMEENGTNDEQLTKEKVVGKGLEGWNAEADYMGGGDNNAVHDAFNQALDMANGMSASFFGGMAPPPLAPRKRNPIPIVDPNEGIAA